MYVLDHRSSLTFHIHLPTPNQLFAFALPLRKYTCINSPLPALPVRPRPQNRNPETDLQIRPSLAIQNLSSRPPVPVLQRNARNPPVPHPAPADIPKDPPKFFLAANHYTRSLVRKPRGTLLIKTTEHCSRFLSYKTDYKSLLGKHVPY